MIKKTIFFLGLLCCIGCEEIVGLEDISKNTVNVLAPMDNSVVKTDSLVVFSWEGVADAEDYHIQLALPSFESASQIVMDSILPNVHFRTKLDPDTYQWRVRALNSEYSTDFSTQTFTVEK